MEQELRLRIILENPTAGVDFALQKGSGNDYEIVQKQKSTGSNLFFEFNVRVKYVDNKAPVFLGPFTQGGAADRFVYIGIGTFAGQKNTHWSRRLKIPLTVITTEMIQKFISDPKLIIETLVAGTGKDGGPNCGTVKPFSGWKLKTASP